MRCEKCGMAEISCSCPLIAGDTPRNDRIPLRGILDCGCPVAKDGRLVAICSHHSRAVGPWYCLTCERDNESAFCPHCHGEGHKADPYEVFQDPPDETAEGAEMPSEGAETVGDPDLVAKVKTWRAEVTDLLNKLVAEKDQLQKEVESLSLVSSPELNRRARQIAYELLDEAVVKRLEAESGRETWKAVALKRKEMEGDFSRMRLALRDIMEGSGTTEWMIKRAREGLGQDEEVTE